MFSSLQIPFGGADGDDQDTWANDSCYSCRKSCSLPTAVKAVGVISLVFIIAESIQIICLLINLERFPDEFIRIHDKVILCSVVILIGQIVRASGLIYWVMQVKARPSSGNANATRLCSVSASLGVLIFLGVYALLMNAADTHETTKELLPTITVVAIDVIFSICYATCVAQYVITDYNPRQNVQHQMRDWADKDNAKYARSSSPAEEIPLE